MRHAKSRIFGLITLILAAAVLLSGVFAMQASTDGTPLNAAYTAANAERSALATLAKAVEDSVSKLERVTKRSADAVEQSEAAIEAAQAALEIEQTGAYDPETEIGMLGQSILEAQKSGANMDDVLVNYAPVFNAELEVQLDDTLTTVKRAESAVEDAAEALQAVIDAALVIDPTASFAEIPAAAEAQTVKLGELIGAQRLLTRGENYQHRRYRHSGDG